MDTGLFSVLEFHTFFERPVRAAPGIPADPDLCALRVRLLREEVTELEAAIEAGDLVEVADACGDIQYVLDGTFLTFGLHRLKAALIEEIHRSNLTKLGADGRPLLRADGKILKGPDFQPPMLGRFIETELRRLGAPLPDNSHDRP